MVYRLAPLFLTLLWSVHQGEAENIDETGTFWHITDIHLDRQYSEHGDPSNMCHISYTSSGNSDNGYYGNFNCDSPWTLVQSAIRAMKNIEPNPDFIIWTGDNSPHVWNPEPDWTDIFTTLRNITRLLTNAFPNSTILPVIGNHDSSPPDKIAPYNESVYQAYLKRGGWEKLLPDITLTTFLEGGFYSVAVQRGIRVIGLNSLLWYRKNTVVENVTDPGGQFSWLEKELNNSKQSGEKVYIIGHISPGHSDRGKLNVINPPLYYDEYNEKYLGIINNYAEIIAGQLFGHLHYDTFELFRSEDGIVLSSALLASSVTPWHSTWAPSAGLSIPVNPSIRLFHYLHNDGLLMDYQQYFLNLTLANNLHMVDGTQVDPHDEQSHESKSFENFVNVTWELLYSFTETYGVSNVSTEALSQVYEMLKTSDDLFQVYYNYTSAAKDNGPCNSTCKYFHLCAIGYVNQNKYEECLQSFFKSKSSEEYGNKMWHHEHHPESKSSEFNLKMSDASHFSYVLRSILIGISALVVLVAVMVSAAWWKRWRLLQGPRYTHFP